MRHLLAILLCCACAAATETEFRLDQDRDRDSVTVDVTGVGDSDSESFTWTNATPQAEVSFSLEESATGAVEIRVRDSAGGDVFEAELTSTGTRELDATTPAGAGGEWEVTITTTNLDGRASVSLDPFEG